MIRMIACDIDGTLLQEGETAIRPELFGLIGRLRKKGILFCTASGRQYPCQLRLLAPVADQICCVCENGAIAFDSSSHVLSKLGIPREDALAMIQQILDTPRCEVLISGERTCYIIPKEPDFLPHMRDVVGNDTTVVASAGEIGEEIIKIAVYCRDGTENCLSLLQKRWGGQYSVAVSGARWVDLTRANKAVGLRAVCDAFRIAPSEVMAFGDNFNDLEMLRMVGLPCVMAHAHPEVKAAGKLICSRVETQLERFLSEIGG